MAELLPPQSLSKTQRGAHRFQVPIPFHSVSELWTSPPLSMVVLASLVPMVIVSYWPGSCSEEGPLAPGPSMSYWKIGSCRIRSPPHPCLGHLPQVDLRSEE